jgi:hypothetical protein
MYVWHLLLFVRPTAVESERFFSVFPLIDREAPKKMKEEKKKFPDPA